MSTSGRRGRLSCESHALLVFDNMECDWRLLSPVRRPESSLRHIGVNQRAKDVPSCRKVSVQAVARTNRNKPTQTTFEEHEWPQLHLARRGQAERRISSKRDEPATNRIESRRVTAPLPSFLLETRTTRPKVM